MDRHANIHANYILQTLLYVSNLALAGERPSLRSMGFRDDQIEVFRNLNVEDAWALSSCVHTHLATIRFDPDVIDVALKNAQRKRHEGELMDDLIRGGASASLMMDLFGLVGRDYAQRRAALGFEEGEGIGRPPKPPEETQLAIWNAWQRHRALSLPERYLAVHRESQAPVRAIHAVISAWETTDTLEPKTPGERHER